MAQTAQFFDLLHRPGNVHDSNGADQFIMQCFKNAKEELKNTIFESRFDSAFFSQTILPILDRNHVKFSASVPFERFPELKKRELQMLASHPVNRSMPKRPASWAFKKLDTLRHRIIQRAGRLTKPQGELTLTMSANDAVRHDLLHFLDSIQKAA